MFNIKIENIVGASKLTNNPDTFLPEVSWVRVNKAKEFGTQGVTFSEKAMSDLQLYSQKIGDTIVNRIVFLPAYTVNNQPEFVIAPTHQEVVKEDGLGNKLPKNLKGVKVVQSTRTATSNDFWKAIVAKFNLDTQQDNLFVIEPVEGVWMLARYEKPVFDEGKDLPINSSEQLADATSTDVNFA